MKHKRSSQSANSDYSPWKTHEEEMWRKTAIRAIAALLPLSPELRDAVASDEGGGDSSAFLKPAEFSAHSDDIAPIPPAGAGDAQEGKG